MPVVPELGLLFNALPRPYLLLSPELVIEAVSDAYLAATLTQRAHLLGQYVFDAFPDNPLTPEAQAVHNLHASLRQVLATGQPHEMAQQHYDVPDPDRPGQFVERHWQPLNAPVLDAQGNVVQLIHSVLDVTAQVQAQARLLASQAAERAARAEAEAQRERFYEVLMTLPAQVATYHGPDHVYNFVNAAYRRYFPTQALPGRSLLDVLPETEALGVLAVMNRVYQTGEASYQQELEVWLDFEGNGQPRQLFLNLLFHPLRDAQGRVDGLLDFSYDVTEQVLARRQVEQLNQELEARVLARTQDAETARAEAERQRARLASVFRQAPAAIAVYGGPDFVFELVNPVYQALLPGRPLLGRPVREAFPEAARLPVFDTLRQVYETGITHHEQDQLIPVPGPGGGPENRYFNFTLQARYDEQHRIDGVVGFGFEVTKQVVARQQADTLQAGLLAAARQQVAEREAFHAVFEQTPALIALLRAPGHRFEYVNPAYQALFPGRQLVGLDLAVAVPEAREQGFVAVLDQVYQTGETHFGMEVPFTAVPAAGGTPQRHYLNFTYQAYREDGHIAGISIFAYDVTEQVLVRQQQALREQQLQDLFEQAPVAIAILRGPEYLVEVANPLMAALWGRTPAEVVGRPLFQALPEIRDQGFKELLDGVRRSGEAFVAEGVAAQLLRNQAYQTVYLNFVYQPLRDADGTITSVAAVATDVTAQVRNRKRVQELNEKLTATNEELHQSNTLLTRTNADLDTFVYTASHDLKAPITNIESIVLALRDTLSLAVQQDEVVAHLLELLDTTVTRFRLTIGQLTDISKLQLAHAGPAEPLLLAQAIENVRLDLVPAIAAAGTQLTVAVDPELVVSFSPANLRSIVYNLLSNAIKYRAAERPSQVRVHAAQTGSRVVLTVQDNGLGMSEVQQRQLFDLFQRLHTHVEGTGVGLYITKRLVENAGGTITVQSQPGVGTTFAVTFPA